MNMQATTPGASRDRHAYRLALQERKRTKSLAQLAKKRKEASDLIDQLIQFLDDSDPYARDELECGIDDEPQGPEDDLEPSLCGTTAASMIAFAHGGFVDGEEEQEDEPSLGSTNPTTGGSQQHWSAGGASDLEDEHDGREPSLCGTTADCSIMDDRDLEADLGSFDRMMDQRKSLRLADLLYNTMGGWPVSHGEFDDVRPVS